MTTRRAKKSSVRRNTKSFKKVDPFWEENPNKLKNKIKKQKELAAKKPKNLESRNKRLRQIAIKSLVKKNAASENERLLKDQDKFFDNRTKYVQQEGESDRDFKQRMQDDVDMALADAQMSKKLKNKKNPNAANASNVNVKGSIGSNTEFRDLIRNELIEQKKITPRKYDLMDKTTIRSSKQHQNDVKRDTKNFKKLEKELDDAEKELFTDKVQFGERVDDIFRSEALPRSVKAKLNKQKQLEKMAEKCNLKFAAPVTKKKKNNGLSFLNGEAAKNVDASDSLYKRRMVAQERQKAIDSYREMKGAKKHKK